MKINNVISKLPCGFKKTLVIEKECYNNTYRFVERNKEEFLKRKMKIAYGFFNTPTLGGNLWIRHCFIIDSENQALDITLLDKMNTKENRYIVFKTFNSVDELLKIDEYMKDTSLSRYLVNYEKAELLKYVDENMKNLIANSKYGNDVVLLNL